MSIKNTQGINSTSIPEFPIAIKGSNTVKASCIFSTRSRSGSTARVLININKIPIINIRGFVSQRIYSERAMEKIEEKYVLFTTIKPPILNYHVYKK